MKKKITLLAIIAVVMTTGIFANPIEADVNKQVKTSFSAKFEGATNVTWDKTEQYIKATFTKDEQFMSAYFDTKGDLIGVARNIVASQLPINANIELKKSVGTGWITELFEFTDGDETSYFATIENADQKVHMKSSGSSQWSVYKRVKKS